MDQKLQKLLPEPDQAVRCVDYSLGLNADPGGSGLRVDRVVVVEVPLPWPKPATAHQRLVAVASGLARVDRPETPTRLLAAVPSEEAEPGQVGIVVWQRTETGAKRVSRWVPESDLELAAMAVAGEVDRAPETDRRSLLICTQGSHDVCCGSLGAALARQLQVEVDSGQLDLEVLRVSHTGGHRFAPTAISLPDGRMWAYLDTDAVTQIVKRNRPPSEDLVRRCRGWWGADVGSAQVAERAVFGLVGWGLDRQARSVGALCGPGGGASLYQVVVGGRQWRAQVEPLREIPTVSCRQPGGLPVKTSVEYQVLSVE